jgi:hypothetical protein
VNDSEFFTRPAARPVVAEPKRRPAPRRIEENDKPVLPPPQRANIYFIRDALAKICTIPPGPEHVVFIERIAQDVEPFDQEPFSFSLPGSLYGAQFALGAIFRWLNYQQKRVGREDRKRIWHLCTKIAKLELIFGMPPHVKQERIERDEFE